jgi:hypothetical protein
LKYSRFRIGILLKPRMPCAKTIFMILNPLSS